MTLYHVRIFAEIGLVEVSPHEEVKLPQIDGDFAAGVHVQRC